MRVQRLLMGLFCGAAVLSVLWGHRPPPPPPPPIEQPIETAFQAARKGDLDTWLAQFDEPLHGELLRLRQSRGDADLRRYLAAQNQDVVGLAVDVTAAVDVAPGTRRIPVEFVYRDHQDVQPFDITVRGICQVGTTDHHSPLVPYGTSVNDLSEAAPF